MVNTTKNEFPQADEPKLSAKEGVEKEVRERYNRGENLYQIAQAVYDFRGEEAVERVRRILNIMHPPETQILDD